MFDQTLFQRFNHGKLYAEGQELDLSSLKWNAHPSFEGVELKHLITQEQSQGMFSYHLVRIAGHKKIGLHVHETQAETHEVIAGKGLCRINQTELLYQPGVISVLPKGMGHEVSACEEGLYLFAKFFPALC